ncbi:MAG: 2-oxo acid dehydrogenase subunit E2 [Alphaproteobacteria bacterium]|nr:2-oxo acid dehydrogenase subunit E2 [Alphaproteobacteria bacterium]MBV9372899.1 2-oxo acid dehydrogenase subunit E2 [Alphaproteobacteria bacterium]MBV9902087.1 2-oxo acid dehydrogenase subunit E2 [Alphaproteobacteria bacterium]
MARYEFKLPDIGEGIAEAEIVAWHVKVGDAVKEDQQLADMMTDKATVEMESPVAGKVVEVAGEVGDQIPIGSVLVVIETEGEGAAPGPGRKDEVALADGLVEETPELAQAIPSTAEDRRGSDRREGEDRRAEPREEPDRRQGDRREASSSGAKGGEGFDQLGPNGDGGKPVTPGEASGFNPQPDPPRVLASPAVRARARDLGIDLAQVRTSADRVRHADLDAYLLYKGGGASRAVGPRRADETVKVVGLRRRIAENMAEAKRRIPHFTLVEEYDVTALEQTRAMMNSDRGGNPKLTLLPFLITAMARTLADYPQINTRYDDDENVLHRSGAVHMGMATQTPNGLMVPVIRNADRLGIWDIAREILRLSEAARTGKAARDELSGSTITISSLGPMGGIASTPVINRPEVAIVAVNKVEEKPVVVDGELEIRKRMNLSLSCDHRVVDGWDAANFMQDLKKLIENPLKLLSM